MTDLLYLMGFLNETPPLGPMAPIEFEEDLHLTLLPAFAVPNQHLNRLQRGFFTVAQWFEPLTLKPTAMVDFGVTAPLPAMLVDPDLHAPNSIKNCHETFLAQALENNAYFHDPYVGEEYKPHISHWRNPPEMSLLHSISLVWHSEGFGRGVLNLNNYLLQS